MDEGDRSPGVKNTVSFFNSLVENNNNKTKPLIPRRNTINKSDNYVNALKQSFNKSKENVQTPNNGSLNTLVLNDNKTCAAKHDNTNLISTNSDIKVDTNNVLNYNNKLLRDNVSLVRSNPKKQFNSNNFNQNGASPDQISTVNHKNKCENSYSINGNLEKSDGGYRGIVNKR